MDRDEAIMQSMEEVSMMTEVEAQERRLKWARDMIVNRDKKQSMKQGKKISKSEREHAMKQAMMNWDE